MAIMTQEDRIETLQAQIEKLTASIHFVPANAYVNGLGHVTVGNIFFRSAHNGSQNPAVDTIAAGESVTWTWNAAGSHTVQSTGVPPEIFRNSVVMAGANDTYTVTFRNPGTYSYDCAIHGSAMTGTIVVQ